MYVDASVASSVSRAARTTWVICVCSPDASSSEPGCSGVALIQYEPSRGRSSPRLDVEPFVAAACQYSGFRIDPLPAGHNGVGWRGHAHAVVVHSRKWQRNVRGIQKQRGGGNRNGAQPRLLRIGQRRWRRLGASNQRREATAPANSSSAARRGSWAVLSTEAWGWAEARKHHLQVKAVHGISGCGQRLTHITTHHTHEHTREASMDTEAGLNRNHPSPWPATRLGPT